MNDDQPARERFEKALGHLVSLVEDESIYVDEAYDEVLRLWDELVVAMREVLRLSDRKHDAWDRAKALLNDEHHAQPAAPVCVTCGGKGTVFLARVFDPKPCPDCKPAAQSERGVRSEWPNRVHAAIAARATAQSEREAWQLVPREPTREMIEAAASFGGSGRGYSRQRGIEAAESYKHMLAAAPQPPEPGRLSGEREADDLTTLTDGQLLECYNSPEIEEPFLSRFHAEVLRRMRLRAAAGSDGKADIDGWDAREAFLSSFMPTTATLCDEVRAVVAELREHVSDGCKPHWNLCAEWAERLERAAGGGS